MFAVISEVSRSPERWTTIWARQDTLKPSLEKIDGFIDNERFSSRRRKGRSSPFHLARREGRHSLAHFGRITRPRERAVRAVRGLIICASARSPPTPGPRRRKLPSSALTRRGRRLRAMTISEWTPTDDRPEGSRARTGLPHAGIEGLVDHELFESTAARGCSFLAACGRRHRRKLGPADCGRLSSATGRSHYSRLWNADRREAPQFIRRWHRYLSSAQPQRPRFSPLPVATGETADHDRYPPSFHRPGRRLARWSGVVAPEP
jgi:hypothetical protein